MPQVIIENPLVNLPFEGPKRHFRFTEDGITDEMVEDRCISQYFMPIRRAKKKNPKQLSFETEWTADRVEESKDINRIRQRVAIWRKGGYVDITKTNSRLFVITNFHGFKLRERAAARQLTKLFLKPVNRNLQCQPNKSNPERG
jgi:type III restriction enzyme